jgi:hypothetical protein
MGPLLQATEGYKALYANTNLGVYKNAESFDAKPLFHEAEAFRLCPSCKETSDPYEVYLWAFYSGEPCIQSVQNPCEWGGDGMAQTLARPDADAGGAMGVLTFNALEDAFEEEEEEEA